MAHQKYTNEHLIERLQDLAKRLGRTPNSRDVKDDELTPSLPTFTRRFGSWAKSAKLAFGVEIKTQRYLTDEELLEELKDFGTYLGHMPSKREVKSDEFMPSYNAYLKRFGSWKEVLQIVYAEERVLTKYTNKQLLDELRDFAEHLGHTPTISETIRDELMPSTDTYIRRFGSWGEAIKAALDIQIQLRPTWTDEVLLQELRDFSEIMGRSPTTMELDSDELTPSSSTYLKKFGSFANALELAGLGSPRHLWSLEQDVELAGYIDSGMHYAEISNILGKGYQSIQSRTYKLGLLYAHHGAMKDDLPTTFYRVEFLDTGVRKVGLTQIGIKERLSQHPPFKILEEIGFDNLRPALAKEQKEIHKNKPNKIIKDMARSLLNTVDGWTEMYMLKAA